MTKEMLENIEAIISILGISITVITFAKALYEYKLQRRDKRAQQFLELRNFFRNNEAFQNIIEHLYSDKDFSSVPNHNRIEFMAFFEDIAFLMNSGLIKKEVAFYMFGMDAVTAWNNDSFWRPDLRTDKFWGLLNDFVKQMEEIKGTFSYERELINL